MKRFCLLMMGCSFLFAFFVISAGAQEAIQPKGTNAEKNMTIKTRQAKPVEMPQATSKRDQVSGPTGYVPESDEETQETPNPLDKNASQAINPLHDPVR